MGGYSLGDLAGILRLDDSQYQEALARSVEATALLRVKVSEIGDSLAVLIRQLSGAGFGLKEAQGIMNSFRAQGLSTSDAVRQLTSDIERMQSKISQLRMAELASVPRSAASDVGGLVLDKYGRSVEAMKLNAQMQAGKGGRIDIVPDELASYRAMQEAQRIRTEQMKEEYRVRQDYLGLTKRLREEEAAGRAQQRAGDAEGARQEREYAAAKAAREVADAQASARLRGQLQAQVDKQVADGRQKAQADAVARQNEIQQQMILGAQGQVRIEKEAQEAMEKQRRDAMARERLAYAEHWRHMRLAQAATVIGGTAVAVGGAGVGAGLFVAKDAAHFQDEMTKSLAVIGDLSTAMRDKLSQAARDAAKETGLHAKDIAADYAIMAKGGLDAAESLKLIPQVSKFAVATNSELHESTRQIITIMEALQLPSSQAEDVMNKLTVANQLARGSVDQLATALEGKAGAALRSAHVSLSESLALVVAFSRAGVTASQSQTFLAQVVERLTYASRQYGNEIVYVGDQQMKFHDIVYKTDGSVRPFIETLRLLDTAFKGRSADQIGRFFDDIHLGSARGAQALKILLSQSDVLERVTQLFNNTGEAMVKAFDMQMQSPLRQLDKLKAHLTDLAITMGIPTVNAIQSMANAMKPLLDMVESLAAKFGQLPTGMQSFILLSGGVASGALLAGGGLLVLIGHVVRLRADLALLQKMDALGSLPATLGALATRLGAISLALITIAGVVAVIVNEYNKIKDQESQGWKRSPGSMNLSQGGFSEFGYVPNAGSTGDEYSGPSSESLTEHRRIVEQNKSAADKLVDKIGKAESEGSMDAIRKSLEEFKTQFKDLIGSGELAIDPEKILKKQLTLDAVRQKFAAYQTEYNGIAEKLTDEERETLDKMALNLNTMMGKGVDTRIVTSRWADLEGTLKQFKQNAAERDKDESETLARENAATSVAAFKERYLADLRTLEPEQKALMESLLGILSDELSRGVDVKQIQANLKSVQGFYKMLTDTIDNTTETQKSLNATMQEWDAIQRKSQKQKPELPPAISRVAPVIAVGLDVAGTTGERTTEIERAMKSAGTVAEETLQRQAQYARIAFAELRGLKAPVNDTREAWLHMREAEIRAEEGLKPLHESFVRLRVEIERLRAEGSTSDRIIDLTNLEIQTKVLKTTTEGLGKIYENMWHSFSGSYGQVGHTLARAMMDIKNAGSILRDMMKSMFESLIGSILQGLMNLAAAWIGKAIGIKAASKGVAATQIMDAAAVALANAMAATAMIPIVGPMLAPAAGEAMYGMVLAQSLPRLLGTMDMGGLVRNDKLSMVHAGESWYTENQTKRIETALGRFDIAGGGGDNINVDLRGAHFGQGTNQALVDSMMRSAVGKLRRNSARTIRGGRM